MLKPLVKWAGGKRQLLSELVDRLPKKWETYYEPFVGGGALLIELYKRRMLKSAVISDLNEELINLYNVVKNYPHELIETLTPLELTFVNQKIHETLSNTEFKNEKDTYLKLREKFNEIIGNPKYSIERAAVSSAHGGDFVY